MLLVIGLALLFPFLGSPVHGFTPECPEPPTLEGGVSYLKETLVEKTLPSWLTAVDEANGGYVVGETTDGPAPSDTKTIISQTRLLWAFSYAHNAGYSSEIADYLGAAEAGYSFIQQHFQDSTYGGYYWSTDAAGNSTDEGKFLQGQCFVILSFSEYFKASNDTGALDAALDVFQLISNKTQDTVNNFGGFFEDFMRNWTVVEVDGDEGSGPLGTRGLKSGVTILHLVESLTSLLMVSEDAGVRALLEQVVDENSKPFYPCKPADIVDKRTYDGEVWSEVPSQGFGIMVEYAWIKAEGEKALGQIPSWAVFDRYVRYALSNGTDEFSNCLMDTGEMVWWAQLEVMKMASTSRDLRGKSFYDEDLNDKIQCFACVILDSEDGIPVWSVLSNGTINNNEKRSNWKAAFHSIRGMGELSRVFG